MKVLVTYRKICKKTGQENSQNFEMDIFDAQINLMDGFWLLNLENSKTEITFEVYQGGQYIINVSITKEKPQTLHLKFYDFDVFLSMETF